jgi:hypothetical protein
MLHRLPGTIGGASVERQVKFAGLSQAISQDFMLGEV